MAKHIAQGTPTQVAHPVKTTLRTSAAVIVAVLIGIVGFGPLIIDAIVQEPIVPESLRTALLAVSAVIVAIGAITSRIMAIPGIQGLLAKIGLGTGVEKELAPVDGVEDGRHEVAYPVVEPHPATEADPGRYRGE